MEDWLQESSYRNCTEDELASLIVNSLAPTIREIPIDGDLDGEPGIVSFITAFVVIACIVL